MSDGSSNSQSEFQIILQKRLSRRSLLEWGVGLGVSGVLAGCKIENKENSFSVDEKEKIAICPLSFKELPQGLDKNLTVAEGYDYQVVLTWGDRIFEEAPQFDPAKQSKASQSTQFGYNNDFVGFIPLADTESSPQEKKINNGLLVVNHEGTCTELMFSGAPHNNELTFAQTEIDIAAHGMSVVEVYQQAEKWRINLSSKYNRRITPLSEMELSGPAAGHNRMKTKLSKDGIRTLGTYGNCAGGVTPWGTVLSGEENVDMFFDLSADLNVEKRSLESFNLSTNVKSWAKHFDRWNLDKNPREILHMGWIVEIDPFDPKSKPKKRTALGRFKHEGANVLINQDGRVVAYMGDDEKFQYVYKFISSKKFQENDRNANLNLLDEGELFVAKFQDDGVLQWLPLRYGYGPLTSENGFESQADVVIDARIAANLLGATDMDRPEDVDINPVNGHVYAMLTNNSRRKENEKNSANPRAFNSDGQIVEFWPESGDHSADTFMWDMFLIAGDPRKTETRYHEKTTENGWLSCPDNCAFDQLGNIWIATDGATYQGVADGLWAAEVSGVNKALTKRFLRTPVGAELCGPFFTPDNETLFCAVQHPADGSHFDAPTTRWPDFDSAMPPRPAVVAVTKKGGGRIGS